MINYIKKDINVENTINGYDINGKKNNTFNASPNIELSPIETVNFDSVDFVLKIMDMFGTIGPSILGEIGSASVLSLFTENNIEFDSLEDIKEVIRVGNNKENFKVVLDNGEQYIFDSDHRIIGIYKDNYSIFYNYDVRETQKDVIREKLGLDDNTKVNFVATTTIKGENIQYYSVGDSNISNDVNFPINFSEQYQKFSKSVLAQISKSLFGIFIGNRDISSYQPLNGRYGAYANSDTDFGEKYIYIPSEENSQRDYYKYNTPLHEMAHIIHSSIDIDNQTLMSLFNQYKTILPSLNQSCYNDDSGYEETPNIKEFFADSITNYYLNPAQLKRYIPEVYNFIDNYLN